MNSRRFQARRNRSRKLLLESLEKRMVLDGSPWHNVLSALDVTHDGSVDTADKQQLDSFLAANNGGPVPVPEQPPPDPATVMYYDVDDNWVVDGDDQFLLDSFLNPPSSPSSGPLGNPATSVSTSPMGNMLAIQFDDAYILEGETAVLRGALTIIEGTMPEEVSIEFGGGTPGTAQIEPDGSFVWEFEVPDDNPTATPEDEMHFTVTATIAGDNPETLEATATLHVANVAPELSVTLVNPLAPQSSGEIGDGGLVELHIQFTDPGVDDTHVAEIDWGDGSSYEVIGPEFLTIGTTTIVPHEYAPQPPGAPGTYDIYNIRITLRDDDTGEDAAEHSVVAMRGDDPNKPQVTIETVDGEASELGPDPGRFRIIRSGPTTNDLEVKLQEFGEADRSSDYNLFLIDEQTGGKSELSFGSWGTMLITIPAGRDSVLLELSPIRDGETEGAEEETFEIREYSWPYSTPYTIGPPNAATISIQDSAGFLSFGIVGGHSIEEDINHNNWFWQTDYYLGFEFVYSGQVPASGLVIPFTLAGTAEAGVDYFGPSQGTVTLFDHDNNGIAGGIVKVFPKGDPDVEPNETVIITASLAGITNNGEPVVIDPSHSSATGTILDDEPTITITATEPTVDEPNWLPNHGEFKVARVSGSTKFAIIVPLDISGDATVGLDYHWDTDTAFLPLPHHITIPAGATSTTMRVLPNADTAPEEDETVTVTLLADTLYSHLGSPSSATITILDDDQTLQNWELVEWQAAPAGFYTEWQWTESGTTSYWERAKVVYQWEVAGELGGFTQPGVELRGEFTYSMPKAQVTITAGYIVELGTSYDLGGLSYTVTPYHQAIPGYILAYRPLVCRVYIITQRIKGLEATTDMTPYAGTNGDAASHYVSTNDQHYQSMGYAVYKSLPAP